MTKTTFLKFFFSAAIIFFGGVVFPSSVYATTFLQDDFTGTTIDTSKWTEIDSQAGGTVGDVQQNGTVTIGNSASPSTGSKALVSVSDFGSTNLEVSATITGLTSIIGYGDRVYNTAGNMAYLL
jgi:hypothetical protein